MNHSFLLLVARYPAVKRTEQLVGGMRFSSSGRFGFNIIKRLIENAARVGARLGSAAGIELGAHFSKETITAAKELKLTKLFVIYPGEMNYPLDEKMEAVAFKNLMGIIPELG